VKIRGFRIEPGGIERHLLSHEGIKASAVIAMIEKGENYLCAYFTSEKKIEIPALRDNLAKKLPNFMIPAYFKQIETMPLTISGKIDRKALALIGHKNEPEIEFVAPQSEIEKIVAAIWQEILGVEQVGIYDNFFNIGGNSLKLITLSTKLNAVLGKNIPLAKLFEHVTIDAFVQYHTGNETGERPAGRTMDKSDTIAEVKKSRERRKQRRRVYSNE
jgi:acyl carrier protein